MNTAARTDPWADCPVPAMRHQALYGDRVVRCFTDRPASVWWMFAAAHQARPAAEALVFDGRRWTYAQADAEAARVAAGLAARGVGVGDRVILFLSNRPEFLWTLLATQRLGAIAVPVGVREQRPGLAYIARQCGALVLVHDDELADRVPGADDGLPALQALGTTLLADWPAPDPASLPPPARPSDTDTAVILYTSGTTGLPKGAMLTHLAVVHSALHYQACMRLGPADRSALVVPASHVTGLVAMIAAMWQVGGALVLVAQFKAGPFVALMAAERITHTMMVPAMYQLCLLDAHFVSHDLSAWRIGGYGGAPMPVASIDALAAALPGLTLMNAYGATETTSPTTLMPAGRTRAHADTVGVALPAADIRVMDEHGHEVAPGETGELWIGGPMVVPGYWANPEATAASFTAGYWHSGDLGSVDEHGHVRILDRKKDMLNRGGFKIYSIEVENVLMAWPGIVEAAVVGVPCPVLGERVHAVVFAPGLAAAQQDGEALRRHCAERLADYKVPEGVHWSAEPLPRNANGKVMKRLLRERVAAG